MLTNLFGDAKKWQEKYERELEIRKQAEKLLEEKSTELYLKGKELEEQHVVLKNNFEELQAQEEELRQTIEELAASNEELLRIQALLNQTNKDLQESEKTLEFKVHERTKDLEKANRVKSEFLANMSHELRTPLNAVLGYTQILMQASDLGQNHKDKISIINKSGEHLLNLINSILDLSKIDAGKMELTPSDFDFKNTLQQIFDMFKLQCEKKGLSFQFDVVGSVPNFIHADESKLKQCLINLIGNAVKFTQKGFVKLTVSKENEQVKFSISDSGRGIPEDKIASILEPFTQIHEHLNTEGGTGLGLAITKKFIEMMGGNLQVESKENIGSSFSFSTILPEVEGFVETQSVQSKIIGYQADKLIKVLIVDDNPVNRSLAIDILEPLQFQYDIAENGQMAIDKTLNFHPDIILMDIRMPGITGIQATEIIRNMEIGKNLKIIAVTASAFEHDKIEYLSKGCDGFVAKPFNPVALLQEMQRLLAFEFVYENVSEKSEEKVAVDLKVIKNIVPIELLKQFEQALIMGKVEEMKTIIASIDTSNPMLQTFHEEVIDLIKNFDFDGLENRWEVILN